MDFRELLTQDGSTLYSGAEVSCEKCDMISIVSQVKPVTFVQLRPTGKRADVVRGQGAGGSPQPRQQQIAQPSKPGFFQKLLGGK